jgi:hypothetical protein
VIVSIKNYADSCHGRRGGSLSSIAGPVPRKARVPQLSQGELIDAPAPSERLLIPVAGWPDYHAQQAKAASNTSNRTRNRFAISYRPISRSVK